jgi:hypothetical protein
MPQGTQEFTNIRPINGPAPTGEFTNVRPISSSESQQVSSGLPGIPTPPLPQGLQNNQTERTYMQSGVAGVPIPIDVPKGYAKPMQDVQSHAINAGVLAGSAIDAPLATASSLATGYATGKGTKYAAGKLGAGPEGQRAAEIGGNIVGGGVGAFVPGLVRGGIQGLAYGANGELTPEAQLLFRHPPEAIFKHLVPSPGAEPIPEPPMAMPKPGPFEGATSTSTPVGNAKLPAPSTTSTTSTGSVGVKATPPPSVQYVQKFGAPEKGIIVDPNAPPPPINKTLVSYDGKQLLEMAKKGDLDALNELIRNPRGINLREALPNAKFLMEPGRSTRIYGGPGSAKALLPAVGIVGAEFNKLGLADPVNPRQQTTLETMMNGPRWKDFDRSEKIEAVRDILGRK